MSITRTLTSDPTTRPVLPRTSSATSGLRFCGMIDEPVENASPTVHQPNSEEAHSTTSSHSRERCTAVVAAAARNSTAKSRSATASIELSATPV